MSARVQAVAALAPEPIEAAAEAFRRDVLAGLALPRKAIPGKYLWDEAGSRLFDEITASGSYYATAAEMALLREAAAEVAATVGPQGCIVEFGSGACHKVGVLLEALSCPRRYVAIDISDEFLRASLDGVRARHPGLDIRAVCADYSRQLPSLPLAREGGLLGFFPGTSIGNMPPREAGALLTRIRGALGTGWLLVGFDPNRHPDRLRDAYGNGLMAALHENILHRMARELGATLCAEDFRHEARLIPDPFRVEARLVARRATTIALGAARFALKSGEAIDTDVSWKYAPGDFHELAALAGWTCQRCWIDPQDLFRLTLLCTL